MFSGILFRRLQRLEILSSDPEHDNLIRGTLEKHLIVVSICDNIMGNISKRRVAKSETLISDSELGFLNDLVSNLKDVLSWCPVNELYRAIIDLQKFLNKVERSR